MKTRFVAWAAVALLLGACADSQPANNNNFGINSNCDETNESGLYLKSLGPVSHEVEVGASVSLRTLVLQQDDGSGEVGGVVPDVTVAYGVITLTGDAQLTAAMDVTDETGIAAVEISATEAGTYQVNASAEGTCPVTFTVSFQNPAYGLEAVTANPVTTWTNRRVNLTVRAFKSIPGQGEEPVGNADIVFDLASAASGRSLQTLGGTPGPSITVQTNPMGMATIQMNTGTQEMLSGVDVTATLQGTAPVAISVKIQDAGTGGCTTNFDCPPDYPLCDAGTCVENPVQSGSCVDDDDCVDPYICDTGNGECVTPPAQGTHCTFNQLNACPAGQMCIAGFCQDPPTGQPCDDNLDCPIGWECINGVCVQDTGPNEQPCIETGDCNSGFVCINGICTPGNPCANPQLPDRLGGIWHFDSTLHLRDALPGFMSDILTVTEDLRDIILHGIDIPSLPSWVEDIINDLIQDLLDEYVPPWAQQLIVALGNISDIIDDMRVLSTVNLIPQGGYEYVGQTTWDIVEFEYQGQVISEDPANIPEIGVVDVEDFTSREICEEFYIDRHDVDNVVHGLIRWAIEMVLTAITCSDPSWPCYYSLEDALYDIIDCDAIAWGIDDLVYNLAGIEVYDAVYNLCDAAKQPVIDYVIAQLDALETTLSLLTLRGQSDIQDDSHMVNGRWYGTLTGGNFDGDFTAAK